MKNKTCCITIITHLESLKDYDKLSFEQALSVFKKRDIFLVIPNKVDTSVFYDKYIKVNKNMKLLKVDDKWLSSYDNYNKTCCIPEFYQLFKDYDYMLLYQTDCWIYEDRLDYFISLGYDWYGAPWPQWSDEVGNGGFCLRKVPKMLEITQKYKYTSPQKDGYEDTWFCKRHKNELKIADLKTASNFSIEIPTVSFVSKVKKYISLFENKTPMGVHGKFFQPYWLNDDIFDDIKNNRKPKEIKLWEKDASRPRRNTVRIIQVNSPKPRPHWYS